MSQEPGESGPGFAPPAGQPPEQQPGPHPWPYGQPPGQQQPYGQQPYPGGQPHGHGPYYGPRPVDPSLAEWWQRLVARIVDGLIVTLITSPLWIWFLLWYFQQLPDLLATNSAAAPDASELVRLELQLFGRSLLVGLGQALVYFAYDWLQHSRWGQTIGKRIMKIKVVALADRAPVTGGAAAKRAAAFAVAPQIPLAGGPFGLLNVLWLLWDKPNRQCLHDKFAHTVVIKVERTP